MAVLKTFCLLPPVGFKGTLSLLEICVFLFDRGRESTNSLLESSSFFWCRGRKKRTKTSVQMEVCVFFSFFRAVEAPRSTCTRWTRGASGCIHVSGGTVPSIRRLRGFSVDRFGRFVFSWRPTPSVFELSVFRVWSIFVKVPKGEPFVSGTFGHLRFVWIGIDQVPLGNPSWEGWYC